MKVSVIGLGRVGLPLSLFIAEKGFEVKGVDIDKEKVERINKGEEIFEDEPGIKELIKKHLGKNFRAYSDYKVIKDCDLIIVIVPLLLDENKSPDFSMLKKACEEIEKNLKKGSVVIIETTLPPLTTKEKIKKWLEKRGKKEGKDFFLAHSPERITAGKVLDRLNSFPKIIGGVSKESGKKAFESYRKIIPHLQLVSDSTVAECIKVFEGVYRDVNIALANQLFKFSEELGIDYFEVRKFANHEYCNLHKPGVGVGGHCIPVYPWFIIKMRENSDNYGDVSLLRKAREINDEMVLYWYKKIIERMVEKGVSKEERIAIKGISFRRGIKSLINSKSLELANYLKNKGFNVVLIDDLYSEEEIKKLGFEKGKGDEKIIFNTYELKFED